MSLEFIQVERDGKVGLIRLNRPKQLNALNLKMVDEIVETLESMDEDPEIRAIVITGNEQAFAAGADIDEMTEVDSIDMLLRDQFRVWDRIALVRKPIIAAVSGFALGGGCELVMNCDIVIASESARFGQPEVNLGVMPGAGGTQRFTKALGKVKAMELLLTGESLTAEEALHYGLINRVVPVEVYLDEAMKLANRIVGQPPIAVRLIKQSVLKAIDLPLDEGLDFERKNFYLLFSSEDQKEGMRAFAQKRKPDFKGK
ncbi:MAG: enoyl-CoA hydratase/isomerase family protein [Bacillaceae bacterium]|nr:enoyl-CoA hydratase/isomerase family protein [Bacillaceae bacterium]